MKTGIIKIYMQKYRENKRIYTVHRLFAVGTNICQVVSVIQSQNNNNNNKTQWHVSKFAVADVIHSINFHAYGFMLVGLNNNNKLILMPVALCWWAKK